jgi:hypothetical protein
MTESQKVSVQGTKFILDVIPAFKLEFVGDVFVWIDQSDDPFRSFDLKSLPWQSWNSISLTEMSDICPQNSSSWKSTNTPVIFEKSRTGFVDLSLNEILAKKFSSKFLLPGRYERQQFSEAQRWVGGQYRGSPFSNRWISKVAENLAGRIHV